MSTPDESLVHEPSVNEDNWPAVPVAFEFVRPSYELTLRRLEAAEGRARAVLTLAATVTFAAPAFAATISAPEKRSFGSGLFFLALLSFALITYWGWSATFNQRVQIVNPMRHYEKLQDYSSELQFKRETIYYAGIAFAQNKQLTERVAMLSEWMGVALLVEVTFLGAWLAGF